MKSSEGRKGNECWIFEETKDLYDETSVSLRINGETDNRLETYMIVTTSISFHQQLFIPRNQPPEQTFDDPNSLNALPSLSNETRVTPRQTQQLEQLGPPQSLECVQRIRFFCLWSESRRTWRSQRIVRSFLVI